LVKRLDEEGRHEDADGDRSRPAGKGGVSEEQPAKRERTCSNDTHISRTDPDATVVGRLDCRRGLFFKAHVTIDGDSRVITDCHVTTGAQHESTVLLDRAKWQTQVLGLNPEEWLADRGYGVGVIYGGFRELGIRTYIPLRDERMGRRKLGPPDEFRYDRKRNVYHCPMGHELVPYKPNEKYFGYRIQGSACQACSRRADCLAPQDPRRPKQVFRHVWQSEFDAVMRRQGTANFLKRVRERSWKVEGVFAETKENHCLDRAQYRGRAKVQMQVYMVAVVHNLKRLAGRLLGGSFSEFPFIWVFVAILRRKKRSDTTHLGHMSIVPA
jgi:hypothetical protein